MIEERRYAAGRAYLLNLVSDIMELQNARGIESDTANGSVRFTSRMYHVQHEYDFAISDANGDCLVRVETDGEDEQDRHRLRQMFALLESLMQTPCAATDNEHHT